MYKQIIVTLAADHGPSEQEQVIAGPMKGGGGQSLALHDCETPGGTVSADLSEEDGAEGLNQRVTGLDDAEAGMLRGHKGHAITHCAQQIGAVCLVARAHKPGLSDWFQGSTTSRIVRHAA